MTYEIPQALKYEEKIIFGLNLKQIGYLSGAAVLTGIILKTQSPLILKGLGAVVAVSVGAVLAFLKIDNKLLSMLNFYKTKQHLGYFDKKMRKIIGVKEISNNTVVLSDNSCIGILQVTPTNFAIKAKKDKEAVIKNYQNFLNSLDFPVQVLVRTVNVNLDYYIKHLRTAVKKQIEKKKNSGLENLFEDYVCFVENYISENTVKNKLFYVCLKSNKPEELDNRLELAREGLANCGLASKRLLSEDLTGLILSFFSNSVNISNQYASPLTIFRGQK